jgi:putative RNase toxin 44 of polymorphic toxin system
VNKGGPWDYKQQGKDNIDFGNFNYGAVGTAFGFSEETLLRAAGWAQRKDKTWKPKYGEATGGPPYGDDPRDQEQIRKGIRYYKCRFASRFF